MLFVDNMRCDMRYAICDAICCSLGWYKKLPTTLLQRRLKKLPTHCLCLCELFLIHFTIAITVCFIYHLLNLFIRRYRASLRFIGIFPLCLVRGLIPASTVDVNPTTPQLLLVTLCLPARQNCLSCRSWNMLRIQPFLLLLQQHLTFPIFTMAPHLALP